MGVGVDVEAGVAVLLLPLVTSTALTYTMRHMMSGSRELNGLPLRSLYSSAAAAGLSMRITTMHTTRCGGGCGGGCQCGLTDGCGAAAAAAVWAAVPLGSDAAFAVAAAGLGPPGGAALAPSCCRWAR